MIACLYVCLLTWLAVLFLFACLFVFGGTFFWAGLNGNQTTMLIHARAPCTTSPSAVALIWSGLIGYWDCKKLVPLNIPQIANWAAVPPDSQSAPGPARQKRSVETGPTDAVVSKLLLSRGSVRPSSGQQLMTLILREVALVSHVASYVNAQTVLVVTSRTSNISTARPSKQFGIW